MPKDTRITEVALELLGLILTELNPEEFSRDEIMAEFASYTRQNRGRTVREIDEALNFLLLGGEIQTHQHREGFFSITEDGVALETFSAAPEEGTEEPD